MNSRPQLALIPLNGCVLVELEQKHKNFSTSEGKYDSRTQGIVVKVPLTATNVVWKGEKQYQTKNDFLLNQRVFWEDFKEGSRITRDGKLYSFIKIEDLRGYEDVEAD